jgi:hypothetical protein
MGMNQCNYDIILSGFDVDGSGNMVISGYIGNPNPSSPSMCSILVPDASYNVGFLTYFESHGIYIIVLNIIGIPKWNDN